MSEQIHQSPWKLVEVADLPVQSVVVEVRERWSNQQVWVQMPSGKWRRGVVIHIGNDGFVAVKVYQRGTPGLGVGLPLENIPFVLKLVNG